MGFMNNSTQLARSESRPAIAAGGSLAIDPDHAWQQVVRRDPAATFFYAVTTTGVVCRPACKSRLPLRSNVRFFASVGEAQAAGFRACLRCRPSIAWSNSLDKVRAHIERHIDRPVHLAEL